MYSRIRHEAFRDAGEQQLKFLRELRLGEDLVRCLG